MPAPPLLAFDHVAVACRTLAEGIAHVRTALGIYMPPGGAHPLMGTHNRLASLGPTEFLEVIAVDPDALPPERPRWFGLDGFDHTPRLGTWMLATPDIEASMEDLARRLRNAGLDDVDLGRAIPITRGNLTWRMAIPDDGSVPLDGAFPTLIEWPGDHPASRMGAVGCHLEGLTVEHPEGERISSVLAPVFADPRVKVRAGPAKAIGMEIATPDGTRTLV